MTGTLIALLVAACLVWAWMDGLHARESAIAHGHRLCAQAGLQLLDQSVAMSRIRVVWRDGLPTLSRRYVFEVSVDGSDRRPGHLQIEGHRLTGWSLPETSPRLDAQADAAVQLRVLHQPPGST